MRISKSTFSDRFRYGGSADPSTPRQRANRFRLLMLRSPSRDHPESLTATPMRMKLPLPRGSNRHVRMSVLQVLSLCWFGFTAVCGLAAQSCWVRIRLASEIDYPKKYRAACAVIPPLPHQSISRPRLSGTGCGAVAAGAGGGSWLSGSPVADEHRRAPPPLRIRGRRARVFRDWPSSSSARGAFFRRGRAQVVRGEIMMIGPSFPNAALHRRDSPRPGRGCWGGGEELTVGITRASPRDPQLRGCRARRLPLHNSMIPSSRW